MSNAPLGDSRTTPPPPAHVFQLVPELAQKSRVAVRLHPRQSNREPARHENKLGGQFLWPMEEPWPVCPEHDHPYSAIMQLRKDTLPELGFPGRTDLFQLLWCPHDHEKPWIWVKPKIIWRESADVVRPMLEIPEQPKWREADRPEWDRPYWAHRVPVPCVVMPERVNDLPLVDDPNFPTQAQGRRTESIEERLGRGIWALPGASPQVSKYHTKSVGGEFYDAARDAGIDYYYSSLSSCPGTKVGGYIHWDNIAHEPVCTCGRNMQHLLSITGLEIRGEDSWKRWLPVEDREQWDRLTLEEQNAIGCPHGMTFGDLGDIYFFICRRCPDWPIATECQCG